jgi:MFS family permease
MPTSNRRQRLIVLVVVLVAAYAINLDTTIVNVALPTLNLRLGAGTSSLQWVVDGYNLAFAALVLAGGRPCPWGWAASRWPACWPPCAPT